MDHDDLKSGASSSEGLATPAPAAPGDAAVPSVSVSQFFSSSTNRLQRLQQKNKMNGLTVVLLPLLLLSVSCTGSTNGQPTAVQCPSLTPPKHGSVVCSHPFMGRPSDCGSTSYNGTRAEYRCEPYYKQEPKYFMRFCTEDGTWTGGGRTFSCVADCGQADAVKRPLITGGEDLIRGQWPWHAAIFILEDNKAGHSEWQYRCGGTLIDELVVLTAAHCMTRVRRHVEPYPTDMIKIYLGKYHRDNSLNDENVQSFQAKEVFVFNDFNINLDSDIALIMLNHPATFSFYVRPACFPEPESSIEEIHLSPGSPGTIVGWGNDESGHLADKLRSARIPVVSQYDCKENYDGEYIPQSNKFCAGYLNGTAVCNGDSGGGLLFSTGSGSEKRWFIRGIVSVGGASTDKHCDTDHYVVFTKVSRFSQWLYKTIAWITETAEAAQPSQPSTAGAEPGQTNSINKQPGEGEGGEGEGHDNSPESNHLGLQAKPRPKPTPMPTTTAAASIAPINWETVIEELNNEQDKEPAAVSQPEEAEAAPPNVETAPAGSGIGSGTGDDVTIDYTKPITDRNPDQQPTSSYDYGKVIELSLLFYEAQRSGLLPVDKRIPYRYSSGLTDVGNNGEDLSGGYYDGTSLVKFGFPMAFTTTILSWSVIAYESAYLMSGQLGYVRNAIRWSTDYFIRVHVKPSELYGVVGNPGYDDKYWGRPEDYKQAKPAYKIDEKTPGSDLAGETSAAFASASIVFHNVDFFYSQLCLQRAKQLYEFADKQRDTYHNSIPAAQQHYRSKSGYGDELSWSALWLYMATNETKYLDDAERHYRVFQLYGQSRIEFSWDDKTPAVQILLAQLTKKDDYKKQTKSFSENVMFRLPRTPKGLAFLRQPGSLRYAANYAFLALQASLVSDDSGEQIQLKNFARNQLHYMLGDSGRSYVVGFGQGYPRFVRHKASSCPVSRSEPCSWSNYNSTQPNPNLLWGALVAGPGKEDDFVDSRANAGQNSVALDFNACFQGAIAGLLHHDIKDGITSSITANSPASSVVGMFSSSNNMGGGDSGGGYGRRRTSGGGGAMGMGGFQPMSPQEGVISDAFMGMLGSRKGGSDDDGGSSGYRKRRKRK